MSRDRKFGFNWYDLTDGEAAAARLERMHEKGWHLESTAFGGWRFRRGEREKVRYAVTYFPEASVYDPGPTEGQLTYADYCAQAGWEFVCAYGPVQYFRSTRPDPIPIETDEREKLRAIHRTVLKTQGLAWCLWLGLTALLAWAEWRDFSQRPLGFVASDTMLGGCALAGSFLLSLLWEMGGYWLWYVRSWFSVARGGKCAARNGKLRLCGTWALLAAMVLLLVYVALLSGKQWVLLVRVALFILLMFGFHRLLLVLKGRGYKREEVRGSYLTAAVIAAVLFTVGMNVVEDHAGARKLTQFRREPAYVYTTPIGYEREVYLDTLPVTLEDLGVPVAEEDHYSYQAEEERSLLAVRGVYEQYGWVTDARDRHPRLYYTVTEIPWDWLRARCWRKQIHYYQNYNFEAVDDPRWGAVEVRKDRDDTGNRYMLLYGDRIVTLSVPNIELTDGQAAILARRLGLSDWRDQAVER